MKAAKLLRWPLLRRLRPTGWIVAFVVFALLTFEVTDYNLSQLSRVACLAIVVVSLDLLVGHAGQISVGQGALFGLGAYATAILVNRQVAPYPVAVLAGAALCFVVGLIIGLPALRLRGLNLGLVTLGLAVVFPELLKKYSGLTGGVFGINVTQPVPPGNLTVDQWMYLLSIAALILALLFMAWLSRSRFGAGLQALRVNEDMAASVGVNLARSKVLVFGASAAMAGFGGGVYQLLLGSATPDTYTIILSLSILFAVVIGGLRSRLGALVGAAFVVYVPDATASLGDRGPQLVYTVALLLTIYLLPRGVVPSLARLAVRGIQRTRLRPPDAITGSPTGELGGGHSRLIEKG